MSFASHYYHFLRRLRVPAIAIVLFVGGSLGFLYSRLQVIEASASGGEVLPPAWQEPPAVATLDWTHFRRSGANSTLGQPDFAKAFRFAGTFFLTGPDGKDIRKAVLGVVAEGRQAIVSEGDEIAGVTVSRISEDRVLLRRGTEVAELRLSFAARPTVSRDPASSAGKSANTASRFGETVAPDSWILRRESLLEYYEELLDEPERLLHVFDSLKPLYTDTGSIGGYTLGVEGEGDFFEAVGLREGDIVLKVNSLEMTNRNRAEFFIKQVVQNQLSAVVIDIERDGQPKRLVYQVR